ncbi:MAG: uracil-DNA glycosylase [Enterobacterales bacterium]|nr:uracil-DNA glycosylase [Enterobacterales bacterium]
MTKWKIQLAGTKQADYFINCLHKVAQQRALGKTIYPPKEEVFEAFRLCELADIKVVILGQDPYHGPNQAHGLCFSVNKGNALPPSLKNIYKELESDLHIKLPNHGDLTAWAKQGVFLLNTVLTVEAGNANSHRDYGWLQFTDEVIKVINRELSHVVFMLWGSPAQRKQALLDTTKHTVLTAPHPSPLSAYRGFFGCQHFSRANDALIRHNQTPINWLLEP